MAKLQLNDDGTATVPLKGRDPVTLDEPSLGEMAKWTDAVRDIEEGLATLPAINPATATVEEANEYNEVVRARTRDLFGGDQPYATLFVDIVNALGITADGSQPNVNRDNLYAWAASPNATAKVLEHFRTPLPG